MRGGDELASRPFEEHAPLWERIVATVLSLYVLAAFVLAGLLLGGGFLWYFDEL